jgi:hypothetical protein
MLCVDFPVCRAVSTHSLFLKSELRLARTVSPLQVLLQRKAERADIGEQDWDKQPSPCSHVRDFGFDIIALLLIGHWEVDDCLEPGLGRPLVSWVGATGLGDAFYNALAFGLVGD